MKKKIMLSMAVILFVIATSMTATVAWFTDEVAVDDNVFTAGTVYLEESDSWAEEGFEEDNWNPGDCTPKFISVTYQGTKEAFLRMQITETWENVDGIDDETWYDRDEDNEKNVNWLVYVGDDDYKDFYDDEGNWKEDEIGIGANEEWDTLKDWFEDEDEWKEFNHDEAWHYHDEWFYYKDGSGEKTTIIGEDGNGAEISAITEEDDGEIIVVGAVCLDGPSTGNEYQGATYTISAKFQAIQASHSDQWEWDEVDFETGE